jgi:acyl-CoA reductase-like NAD-dependent aldehyde dehydrogenase
VTPVSRELLLVGTSAGNLSRLTLELGGNDAGIVLPDVDPDQIATACSPALSSVWRASSPSPSPR